MGEAVGIPDLLRSYQFSDDPHYGLRNAMKHKHYGSICFYCILPVIGIILFIGSGFRCQLSVIGYQLSVISYRLSVISYRLLVIGYQLSVIRIVFFIQMIIVNIQYSRFR